MKNTIIISHFQIHCTDEWIYKLVITDDFATTQRKSESKLKGLDVENKGDVQQLNARPWNLSRRWSNRMRSVTYLGQKIRFISSNRKQTKNRDGVTWF